MRGARFDWWVCGVVTLLFAGWLSLVAVSRNKSDLEIHVDAHRATVAQGEHFVAVTAHWRWLRPQPWWAGADQDVVGLLYDQSEYALFFNGNGGLSPDREILSQAGAELPSLVITIPVNQSEGDVTFLLALNGNDFGFHVKDLPVRVEWVHRNGGLLSPAKGWLKVVDGPLPVK
jgi:hypothetical protein